ncbi:MAG: hypothetical protein ABIP93_14595 [Gemmatimonadaceae bacterium]
MHDVLTNALLELRWSVAEHFGLTVGSLFGDVDGDTSQPFLYHAARAPKAFLDAQLQGWTDAGWFTASLYGTSTANAQALRALLATAQHMSTHTIVLLMPESSELRRLVPTVARTALMAVLGSEPDISIIDLQASMPDSLFHDYAHLNAAGRAAFTTIVAGELSRRMGCGRTGADSP